MKRMYAILACVVMAGCKTTPPPAPPPEAPFPVVQLPPPALDTGDLAALRGRKICLDPGHGGPWSGAVAPSNSLREADVNLNVARLLSLMLERAGATAIMTRQDDSAADPASLGADLAARAAIANTNQVDALVSIHHNADIDTGSEKNDLEVYYKLREEGASLDLAQILTRSLARELGASATARRLLPGNYKVLRLAEVPAVLLESSYLTQAANAANLAMDSSITAEAHAIAIGLANYFALDPPQLAAAECVALNENRTHELRVRFSRGLPVDLGTAGVLLDGKPNAGNAEASDAGFVWTFGGTLPNGKHTAQVFVRNARGAGLEFPVPFTIHRPPARMTIVQEPETFAGRGDFEALLEAHVYDTLGLPVADDTPVTRRETGEAALTHEGIARFYVARPGDTRAYTFASANVTEPYSLRTSDARYRSIRLLDSRTKQPVGGAVVAAAGQTLGVTTPEGWHAIPIAFETVTVLAPGFDPAAVQLKQGHTEILMNPVAGGVLAGKTLVLDPAHGGRDPGAVSPDGMRASDYALEVARRCAQLLRAAGATVHLTRQGDSETPEPQRVLVAEQTAADVMISISFGSRSGDAKTLDSTGHRRDVTGAFVGHYPNGAEGTRLAEAIGRAFGGVDVVPSVAYVVQQTGCPTVLVQPADIASVDVAARYRSPEARQQAAKNLYQGIVSYYEAQRAMGK